MGINTEEVLTTVPTEDSNHLYAVIPIDQIYLQKQLWILLKEYLKIDVSISTYTDLNI